jgi:hypothetical protein
MIEIKVYDFLVKRGYGMGNIQKILYIQRQLIKCMEELGEVARYIFSGKFPPVEEIMDAIIPLLAICAVLGYDFEKEVIKKASEDVKRGVRGTTDIV